MALQRRLERLVASLRASAPARGGAALLLLVLSALSGLAARRLALRGPPRPPPPLPVSLSAVLRLLRENSVQELAYGESGAIQVQLKAHGQAAAAGGARYVAQLVPGSEAALFQLADSVAVPKVRYAAPARTLGQAVYAVLPLIFLAVWYKAAKSLLARDEKFTPPRGKERPTTTTNFSDVVSHSKVELAEIVDYLNRPSRYVAAGARLPRGVLLVGPSGTGKTLLARAVAGEARCAFLSASASEFVEVYVGRGAARVRDLFRQARSLAPAVLFLDELDALGSRSRSGDARGTNEEYVQTLNQLLTELDGFHGQADGVVVLAATNRREAIDTSLLRPGRFDRHVLVELPDAGERLEILQLHAEKAQLARHLSEADMAPIAAASQGLSGAELANIINEAVFLALRERRPRTTPEDLAGALERVQAMRQQAGSTDAPRQTAGRSLLRPWPVTVASW